MGHATAIQDALKELEQAAQRLTQQPPEVKQRESLSIVAENKNKQALTLRLPAPDLLADGRLAARQPQGS